jgi:hypothetical protein
MEAGVKYIDEVFRVVRQNATNINDVPTLQKLLEAVGSFYVSLFAPDDRSEGEYQLQLIYDKKVASPCMLRCLISPKLQQFFDKNCRHNVNRFLYFAAIFERRAMKGTLAKAPRIRPAPRQSASSSQDGDTPGRGLGKGRPGEPRKEDVTKRQKRNRAEKQITPTPTPSKRARDTTPSATPPPAQRPPNQSPQNADRPRPPAPEPRRELRLQTITASGTKREMAIKRLGEGEKDQPPTHKELFLFFQEMDEWQTLDKRLVSGMREIHAESVRIADDDELEAVIKHMLQLVALQNGVANCSRHALGCMVRAVHDRNVDDEGNEEKRIGATLDQMQGDLNDAQYVIYGASLEKCGCDECAACVQFDKTYNE